MLRFFGFICLLSLQACAPAEGNTSREVKRETREQRKYPVVLSARNGSSRFNLRQNNFFDYVGPQAEGSRNDLFAGTYELKGDSLLMAFHNNHKPSDLTGTGIVNRAGKELVLHSREPGKERRLTIE